MKSRRARARKVLGVCLGVGLAGAAAAHTLRVRRENHAHAALSGRLDADIAAYRAAGTGEGRYAPPPLRGDAVDGNAALEARRAIASLHLEPPLGALPPTVTCDAPSRVAVERARAHASELATLRDASRRSFAWTHTPVEEGTAALSHGTTEQRAQREALSLLLALASDAPPGECLRMVADTVRLAQDSIPGDTLVGAMLAEAEVEWAPPAALRCAKQASTEELAEAARAFASLAAHAPPIGSTLELETLLVGVNLRFLDKFDGFVPRSEEQLELLKTRGDRLGAWDELTRDPARLRKVGASDYPGSLAIVSAASASTAGSTNTLVQLGRPNLARWVVRDMTVQAKLRATAILLDALARRAPDGALSPPPALDDPALRDPFTGAKIGWASTSAKDAKAWSAGQDRRDDGGRADSDDVVVSVCAP